MSRNNEKSIPTICILVYVKSAIMYNPRLTKILWRIFTPIFL